ncbi:hypothetical protein [Roseateles violae]|uniref:Uncharacterized protein n=1 Tax=Roseateles violae TaxID=3058042 RepID=A0ABT8DSP7_9BURK|nr:hypothetical protein [Pelomonas sp. PFR6]MDN3919367.1 hypothetical protein [Pelomonas sp. PFR6]
MSRSPAQILDSIRRATELRAALELRASNPSIADKAEYSVLGTTIRRIEELLQIASEYDEILRRQVAATSARIEAESR